MQVCLPLLFALSALSGTLCQCIPSYSLDLKLPLGWAGGLNSTETCPCQQGCTMLPELWRCCESA